MSVEVKPVAASAPPSPFVLMIPPGVAYLHVNGVTYNLAHVREIRPYMHCERPATLLVWDRGTTSIVEIATDAILSTLARLARPSGPPQGRGGPSPTPPPAIETGAPDHAREGQSSGAGEQRERADDPIDAGSDGAGTPSSAADPANVRRVRNDE